MQKIYNVILSPAIVKAIKDVEDGKGVQLLNMQWESQTASNKDVEETMFIFLSFSEGKTVTFPEPKITDTSVEDTNNKE